MTNNLLRASLVSAIYQLDMTGNADMSPLPVYACTVAYNLDALVYATDDRGSLIVATWDGGNDDAVVRRHHSLTKAGQFKTFESWMPWYDCFQNSRRDDALSALRFDARNI